MLPRSTADDHHDNNWPLFVKCVSILFDGAPLQMVRVEHDMFLEVDSTTIVVPHYVYTCSHGNWPIMLFSTSPTCVHHC